MTHVVALVVSLAAASPAANAFPNGTVDARPPAWTASQAAELVLPNFEAALRGLRDHVMVVKAERAEAKVSASGAELSRLASDTRGLQWTAQRLKFDLQDLRRRAQRYNPAQPNSDPFFRNDLNRAVWGLRDLQWEVQRIRMDADRVAASAGPAPDLIQHAQNFVDSFVWSESEIGWLASEARWAEWDIRRAGFSMEAWDVSRYSSDAERDVRDAHRAADDILRKVRQPVPAPAPAPAPGPAPAPAPAPAPTPNPQP